MPSETRTARRSTVRAVASILVLAFVPMLLTRPAEARSVAWEEHVVDLNFDVREVVLADIDGDGDLDAAGVSASPDDEVAWWENESGDGSTWQKRIVDSSFDFGFAVAAADIDGDGDLDLAGAATTADQIAWWENLASDGTLWSKHVVDGSFDEAIDVVVGDMDGDGDADLVGTASNDDLLSWWENTTGDGEVWSEHVIRGVFEGANEVFVADIDGDGALDVAGWGDDDDLLWWENNGDGTAWTESVVSSSTGGQGLSGADIDGDGDLDLIGASDGTEAIYWWDNVNGDGSSWAETLLDPLFDGSYSVDVGDIDGDGDIDFMGTAYLDNTVAWWDNREGDGSFWTKRTVSVDFGGALTGVVGDVDGDGDLDLFAGGFTSEDLSWWENRMLHRSATFAPETLIATPSQEAHGVFAADLDGDGDLDALVASALDDTVAWYESDGAIPPSFTERLITDSAAAAQAVYAADINGDGRLDVLSASVDDDSIRAFANQGGSPPTFVEQMVSSSANGAFDVHAADLDDDGDIDILSASRADDTVRWFENNGETPPVFLELVITDTADSVRSIFPADLDGDGDLDVLVASREDDTVRWFESNGGSPPAFLEQIISNEIDGARDVYAADMNGDGRLDVLSAAENVQTVLLHTNQGGSPPTFVEQVVSDIILSPLSVSAADFDVDGDLDVLVTSRAGNSVVWFESDGGDPPAFETGFVTSDAAFAQDAVAADFDRDGDLDTLVSTLLDYKLAWFENCGGEYSLATTDTAPPTITEGGTDDVLAIELSHLGRVGDVALGLTSLELLFQDPLGDPYTTEAINLVVDSLSLYLDDGSGAFEQPVDVLVAEELFLTLVDGVFTYPAGTGNPDFQVPAGGSSTYFVVVSLTSDAASQAPNTFRVTHLTEVGGPQSRAENVETDLVLLLECADNVESGFVTPVSGALELTLSGSCPGTITLEIDGAQPNSTVTIVAADAEGSFVKPSPPCQGLEIALDSPAIVTSVPTDASGAAVITPVVNDVVCGRFLQLVELAVCQTSNVVQLP